MGSDERTTLNELAELLSRAWGVPTRVAHLPARSEVDHAHASHAKLRCFFGEIPSTPLAEGLAATVAWAKQRFRGREGAAAAEAREEPYGGGVEAVEVARRLPPSWRRDDLREVAEVEQLRPARRRLDSARG